MPFASWLIQLDSSNYSHFWGQQQRRSLTIWQEKQPNTPQEIIAFKDTTVHLLSPPLMPLYQHGKWKVQGKKPKKKKMQDQHAASSLPERKQDGRSWMIHIRREESGFLSVRLIKIPGTENAGCDVRRAGGVGLICMSRQLLHLQTGSLWACLSTLLAAHWAYGTTEGIHVHIGAGWSQHPQTEASRFLRPLRSVGWLVPFCGLWLVQSSQDEGRGGQFSLPCFIDFYFTSCGKHKNCEGLRESECLWLGTVEVSWRKMWFVLRQSKQVKEN